MILDERTEFADATALSTAGTGLAAVGDVVDSTVARDLGNGRPLYLVIQVTTAVTSAGAATVAFQLVSDTANPPAADGTETLHWESADIGKADLVAGYELVVALPPEGSLPYERFVGIQQNVGTAALTAGAVNAFLTLDPIGWKAYPDGDK